MFKTSRFGNTEPWTMEDLDKATTDLDNGKARDALNHANELQSILDRLIHNDCYHIIDQNLTDGNVGEGNIEIFEITSLC